MARAAQRRFCAVRLGHPVPCVLYQSACVCLRWLCAARAAAVCSWWVPGVEWQGGGTVALAPGDYLCVHLCGGCLQQLHRLRGWFGHCLGGRPLCGCWHHACVGLGSWLLDRQLAISWPGVEDGDCWVGGLRHGGAGLPCRCRRPWGVHTACGGSTLHAVSTLPNSRCHTSPGGEGADIAKPNACGICTEGGFGAGMCAAVVASVESPVAVKGLWVG